MPIIIVRHETQVDWLTVTRAISDSKDFSPRMILFQFRLVPTPLNLFEGLYSRSSGSQDRVRILVKAHSPINMADQTVIYT